MIHWAGLNLRTFSGGARKLRTSIEVVGAGWILIDEAEYWCIC